MDWQRQSIAKSKNRVLQPRKWEEYKGTRFYNGQHALVVKNVDRDSSQMPVTMIIN